MPIQTSYPGVYIQEIPSGVRTITGVSTSIAAFFGRTQKGPINKAVRCLSYSDFLREFGGAHNDSELGFSVSQFFGNGGTDCYVVRLAHGARKAEVTLRNLGNADVLKFLAKNEGLWGNNIRLTVDYNTPRPDDTFNLIVSQEENGQIKKIDPTFMSLSMNPQSPRYAPTFVSQSSTLVDVVAAAGLTSPIKGFSEGRRVIAAASVADLQIELNRIIYPDLAQIAAGDVPKFKFEISVDGGQYRPVDMQPGGALTATTLNGLGSQLTQRINNNNLPPDEQVTCTLADIGGSRFILKITSDTTDNVSVNIRSSASDDLAGPMMLGLGQGGIEVTKFSDLRPAPTAIFYSGDLNELANLVQSDTATTNDLVAMKFTGASAPDDVNFVVAGTNVLVTTVGADTWFTDNIPPAAGNINEHSDGVREKLAILVETVNNKPDSPVTAELWGYRLAFKPMAGLLTNTYTISSTNKDLAAQFKSNVRQYALGDASVVTGGFQSNEDRGVDETGDLEVADYTGSALDHTGFNALDRVDLFNLMVIPRDKDIDYSRYQQLFGPATTYCEKRRAFLLIDAPTDWTQGERMAADAIAVDTLRAGVVKQNSAIFYPRVQFSDAGIKKYVGASGMIGGLMARTDSQRGVWKAPAGTEADLRGVLDLELNMTDMENGVLNKLGVNCLRKFPNGIVNWGARTLDGSDDFGSEWKYIPIRRLALFLEESLYRGTKWVVFEPNDEPLWAKIRLNINAFMMGLFRQGAFQGSTPDKAFFVKCDGETTTANDRNLGIVNIVVGFAPLKPAEFVIISIQQIPDV
jgi:phage tail sheath protein FI